jgi:hypothetical protein
MFDFLATTEQGKIIAEGTDAGLSSNNSFLTEVA